MVNNSGGLEKVTHVIMDEVHERDINIDFILKFLKKKNLKMVVNLILNLFLCLQQLMKSYLLIIFPLKR